MKKRKAGFFHWSVFLPLVLLLPYVFTILINGADKALSWRPAEKELLVPLVLMGQVKDEYEPEMLKAQAVLARGELYRRLEEESVFQVLEGVKAKMREKLCWGWIWQYGRLIKATEQYTKAAEETKGKVLTYEGKLRLTPYHEISSGMTRDGTETLHSEGYEYLVSVDSSQDKNAPGYVTGSYINREQLPQKLAIKERDEAGYVTVLTADEETLLGGEEFRIGMHLASADFSIQKVGKTVRFLCKGKGHGLGLSQYGANEMAKAGSEWKEILETYFPKMQISYAS